MAENQHEEALELLKSFVQPWHAAVAAPAEAQRKVLNTLLEGYARTDYGKTHGAVHNAQVVGVITLTISTKSVRFCCHRRCSIP